MFRGLINAEGIRCVNKRNWVGRVLAVDHPSGVWPSLLSENLPHVALNTTAITGQNKDKWDRTQFRHELVKSQLTIFLQQHRWWETIRLGETSNLMKIRIPCAHPNDSVGCEAARRPSWLAWECNQTRAISGRRPPPKSDPASAKREMRLHLDIFPYLLRENNPRWWCLDLVPVWSAGPPVAAGATLW